MADTNLPNAAPPTGPQLIVNVQYVKDLSFENPRAPQSLMPQPSPPEIKLDVRVDAKNLAPEAFEVVLSVSARATRGEEPVFLVELTYAGVVTLQNVPREHTQYFVLVETPRLLFPFARSILADATRDGGFPPLFIQPIDFGELLRRQQSQSPEGNALASAPVGNA
ncbi:MAG TPA: protein-export chaperone SecB [Stellaceae bacterium]|nr:protein-export chaperone SecB [Stellaceae bacterium]